MLPGIQPDLQEALDLGITLYAGEAEGRLDEVLLDAAAGSLKPLYNYMNDLPGISRASRRPSCRPSGSSCTGGRITSFDAGRGCPFQCSFCTIINVQGRKSRYRTADDVEQLIRRNLSQGVDHFFITDDNFARNRNWEPIFDRLIAMREQEKLFFRFVIQVDTLCHKIPDFITKAARAGVTRVFIGLENINPDNLLAAKKKQNRISEYRADAAGLESRGLLHLCRLHPGLPRRHPRKHPAGHQDHQARAPARSPGILLPHPAAGLRGPQETLHRRRPDGPRHERLRPRARLHRASKNVEGGVGAGLQAGLGDLLHARPHGDDHAPRRGDADQPRQDDVPAPLVLGLRRRWRKSTRCKAATCAARSAPTAARPSRSRTRSSSTRATPGTRWPSTCAWPA